MSDKDMNEMKRWQSEKIYFDLNPPLVCSPGMAKLIEAEMFGEPIEIKKDNRYKDGNIKIVKNVVRGNQNTVELKRWSGE